ncbi:MAG TPA: ATP-binding cassette domain-containing protein, partial [Myxococcota bacterium]|nr:ATP-binding cassette domain-containing protein [Myxococcota bacterium]
MAHEFVFTMQDLRKVVSGDRIILEDITLAFLPGAKIGVLGSNGAGKSTLLRIMAGVDTDFVGEARPTPGVRVGFLPQEPQLDASLDVLGNVEKGVKPVRDLLHRFEEIGAKFAEPMDDDAMNALLEKQAKLQDRIDAVNAWELDRQLEVAMDALRLPP